MNPAMKRKLDTLTENLVRLSAPTLKDEPRREHYAQPTLVNRNNIKRVWSF